MIFVQRTAEPAYLAARRGKWLQELRDARRARDRVAYKKAEGRYAAKQIREALDAMFSGKCAYCESVIGVVAAAHIEHFRPKQKYPSLTFSWDNLFLGCPLCNDSANKGSKFPKKNDGGPLIDPTRENPDDHLEFFYDLVSRLVLVRAKTARGELVIDMFGLNSRTDLVRARTYHIKTLMAMKADEPVKLAYAEILSEARTGRSPWQAWIRALGL